MSVVVPAFNEERHIGATLEALGVAIAHVSAMASVEILVVDDGSTDRTPEVATAMGALVVQGDRNGIGSARNVGARAATGVMYVFVDADTIVPSAVLKRVFDLHAEGVRAIAVPAAYETARRSLRPLLALWRWYAPRRHVTQGVFQAFDHALFAELGGYDERLLIAEDTDLFDRAIRHLPRSRWQIVSDLRVHPSTRRLEQTSALRLWVLTNPLTTTLLRRVAPLWRDWYRDPPR
jgi:glycosyltransferase involved in cell wall biosynthesis